MSAVLTNASAMNAKIQRSDFFRFTMIIMLRSSSNKISNSNKVPPFAPSFGVPKFISAVSKNLDAKTFWCALSVACARSDFHLLKLPLQATLADFIATFIYLFCSLAQIFIYWLKGFLRATTGNVATQSKFIALIEHALCGKPGNW